MTRGSFVFEAYLMAVACQVMVAAVILVVLLACGVSSPAVYIGALVGATFGWVVLTACVAVDHLLECRRPETYSGNERFTP